MIWAEDDGKGHRPDLLVAYGGDITLLIHDGKKLEELILKDGTIPDPSSTENAELKVVQPIIKRQLEGGEKDKWGNISNACMEVSEETSMGFHHVYTKNICTDHQK